MNKQTARRAASEAAGVVFAIVGDKRAGAAFSWTDCLSREAADLFRYIERHPQDTAEQLYRYAVGGDVDARPWDRVHEAVRASLEILRATYLALLRLTDADEGKVVRMQRGADREELRP